VRNAVLWRPLLHFNLFAVVFFRGGFFATLDLFTVFFVTCFFFIVLLFLLFDISITRLNNSLVAG
jgi:hypothetical protein